MLAGRVKAGRHDRAGQEPLAVLAHPDEHPLPLAVAQRLLHDRARPAGGDVFGGVQDVRRGLAEDFLGLVAVQPPGSLVPQEDRAVEAFADDGIVGGRLEDADDELQRVLGAASHEGGVEEHGFHGRSPGGFT